MDGSSESRLEKLEAAIERLADQVAVLTAAVDELTDEVQWRNNELRNFRELPAPFVLKSMPKDPLAKDWRINRVRPEDLPADAATAASARAERTTLFE